MERFNPDSLPSEIDRAEALVRLRDQLDFFVFFHLGSDADVAFDTGDRDLRIAISHPRVRPFELQLTWERVAEMARSPEIFESFLLEQLTRHRRHHG